MLWKIGMGQHGLQLQHHHEYQPSRFSDAGAAVSVGNLTQSESCAAPCSRRERGVAKGLYRRLVHWLAHRKKTRRASADIGVVAATTAAATAAATASSSSSSAACSSSTGRTVPLNGSFGWYTVTARTRTPDPGSPVDPRLAMEATWPQMGRRDAHQTADESSDDGESGFEDDDCEDDERTAPTDEREWTIPLDDLEFGERLAHGRRRDIYRGRWHGEVLIHTFTPRHEQHVQRFLRQVTSLSMIRHENVALFMGACVEPQCLAIVTSPPTGPSLFEFVHVRRENMLLTEKIRIGHQVAQAMGYLHAKTLVHGRLTSRNVFLEGRVQVSLLDHGLADTRFDRPQCGCLPHGHLTYLSPELMRGLQVAPPRVMTTAPATQQTDVYAFGTLLYELTTGRWPFQDQSAHSIIWQVTTGQAHTLKAVKGPSSLKDLLSSCWDFDPLHRPLFPKIVRLLQRSVALHRRFSSSEPERLNRLEQRLAC